MNTKERITAFIKKHPTIVQELLPNVWLYWSVKTKEGVYYKYYDTQAGTVYDENPDWIKLWSDGSPVRNCWLSGGNYIPVGKQFCHDKMMLSSGSDCYCLYFKYDDELEVMEFRVVFIDTHRYNKKSPQENIRKWGTADYWSVAYLLRGDKSFYDKNGNPMTRFDYGAKAWNGGYHYLSTNNMKAFLMNIKGFDNPNRCSKEFLRYGEGYLYGANGRVLNPKYSDSIYEYFMRPISDTHKGKVGKLIDELTAIPLKDLGFLEGIDTVQTEDRWAIRNNDIIYIENIGNGWSCFRYNYKTSNETFEESYRFYIHENGQSVICRKTAPNTWRSGLNQSCSWGGQGEIYNYEEGMAQNKRLSYIANIVTDISPKTKLSKIITIVQNPIVEQLYKGGYPCLAKQIAAQNKVKQNLQEFFGKTNLRQSSLTKKLGINKSQLEMLESNLKKENADYYGNTADTHCIADIKLLSGLNDISSLDANTINCLKSVSYNMRMVYISIDTFKELFNATVQQRINFWKRINNIKEPQSCTPIVNDWRFTRQTSIALDVLILLRDGIRSYNSLPVDFRPNIEISNIRCESDIKRFHDGLITLANSYKEEIAKAKNKEKAEAMEKTNSKNKFLEYEDEEFAIVLPKTPSDIINEGSALHHCVGGYVDTHIKGNSVILFLRRKNDIEKSFYTIEVSTSKDKYVKQIHGFGNRYLGNNPEAIPFVMRWLKIYNIACNDVDLLSTSLHYGSSGASLVPKPQI